MEPLGRKRISSAVNGRLNTGVESAIYDQMAFSRAQAVARRRRHTNAADPLQLRHGDDSCAEVFHASF